MKIDAFLTCLGYYGMITGGGTTLEGAYSLSSGTTGIVYNQVYSTGAHFIGGQIYSPTLPLINVYGNKIISSGIFSGNQGLHIGYSHIGNFSVVMDVEYSGCNRPNNQRSMVLLSTASDVSGLSSGFVVGITESNRLYFSTSGYSKTLERELSTREFVYVSLTEKKYVSIGTYNFNDNYLYKQNITLTSGTLNSKDIYIGNFLRTSLADQYTGFSGKINQMVLFNDSLTNADVGTCSNCMLTTGFITGTNNVNFSGYQVTGVNFSGIFDYQITGYINITGDVTSYDGSVVKVVFPSGQSGLVQTGISAMPAFSGIVIQAARDYTIFQYDTPALNALSTYSLYFNLMLSSGDTIEFYSYPQPNTNIGKRMTGLVWPYETGQIQLVANGLNETYGVDYFILRNALSGYYLDDVLSYDVIVAPSIVTAYSGYWNDTSRILMSGGAFYPSTPQYFENANFTGMVKITGLSGICTSNPFYPQFGYDLHMNGQKLISGMHYDVATSGASGFVVSLSGKNLPQLIVYGMYDITGGGPTGVSSVDDNELAFIPQFSGFARTRIDVSGDGFSYGNFTGFGEQVWVNGIRQLEDLDYVKVNPCSLITGVFNPPVLDFIMYDSDATNSMWNMQLPPTITGISGASFRTYFMVDWHGLSPTSGNDFEVYSSQLVNSLNFGPFVYNGFMSNWDFTPNFTGGYYSTGFITSGILLARYHVNNMASEWFYSTGFSMNVSF